MKDSCDGNILLHGLVSPDKFREAAQDTGLIAAIDKWEMLEACRHACRWQSQYAAVRQLLRQQSSTLRPSMADLG